MDRRVLIALSTGALVAVLFAFVSSSGGVGLWTEPSIELTPSEPAEPDTSGAADALGTLEFGRGEKTLELPAIVEWSVMAVVVVLLALTLWALIVHAWRNRPRLRWRRRDRCNDDPFDVLPDVAEAVIDDAAAQRAELLRGATRNAIVQCWLRLEGAVERAGLERDDADTPAEFTSRVLGRYDVDPEAIDNLAALYREARFSDHVLGETEREAAVVSLDALHRSLRDVTTALEGPAAAKVGR
jgi:hypothetical protein